MATQGLISIVKDGRVIFKCIAGSDGYRIDSAVEAIKKIPFENLTINKLFETCKNIGFGDHEVDLVIQTERENRFGGDEDFALGYYDTRKFHNPEFNPRLECGLADFTQIINY